MRFEWDENKRLANIRKHRVDFEDAVAAFRDPVHYRLDGRMDYGEERWIAIGLCGGVPLFIVFTESEDGVVRLISARKADRYESEILEDQIRKDRH